ncbi:Armadillo-type fold [Trinorchestia longiramus]|nr:Armadillo-type fold [Trinorchestia longiramus]
MVVCMDHVTSLGACPETAPPLYMCLKCKEVLEKNQSNVELQDVLKPMTNIATSCENKNCRSTEKNAIATCFSLECCVYNNNKPVRYCSQCNTIRHSSRRGTADHKVHMAITSVWDQPPQITSFLIECIVSLLSEAQPIADKVKTKESERLNRNPLLEEMDQGCTSSVEDGRVLSRYGVWLVVGLCTPNLDTPVPLLGRILGALCHWFTVTQYMPDDQHGVTIERLKSEHLQGWLQEVCKTHFDVFVDCLLPHPPEYCRVGGHWETLSPRSEHVVEGFRRLFCLVPYEVVTISVWETVMPHWLEAIHREVTEDHLQAMKIPLSKLLDNDMSPLGFDSEQMFRFLAVRFENTSAKVQEQNLEWLQMLSLTNISVPIYMLMSMFENGVWSFLDPEKSKAQRKTSAASDKDDGSQTEEQPELEPVSGSGNESSPGFSDEEKDGKAKDRAETSGQSDPELVLTCYVLMLDIAYKQMEVQNVTKHQPITSGISTTMWQLLNKMLRTPYLISHECKAECTMCFLINTFFQLCTEIVTYLCPKLPVVNSRVADIFKSMDAGADKSKSDTQSTAAETSKTSAASAKTASPTAATAAAASSPAASKVDSSSALPLVMTATVATVGDMDLVANMPHEQVVEAIATATTCTEDESASATAEVAKASVVGADDQPIDTTQPLEEEEDVWVTSQGNFKFKLEDLPAQLQVVYALLERLSRICDGDEVYHICLCLKYLVLHGEAFTQTAHQHRGILLWCQENITIHTMWALISGEWSHVSEVCVSLLMHFVALPDGPDVFWKLCENQFNHTDWKVRFQAVEKVVVLGRFLHTSAMRGCRKLAGALAHAFCYLVASLDDLNVAVAQRATLGLTSLPDSGLKALCSCLEQQFDWVILDRPMIIQTFHQLSSCLPDRRILTWEFFYNRFEGLYLESQVTLENRGDLYQKPRDLRNVIINSENLHRKYSRAQEALNLVQSSSAKTLCSSLGPKCPYKRTMSAPANMLNKLEKPVKCVDGLIPSLRGHMMP